MATNILHRLVVRKIMIASGLFSQVISREAGNVEATFKATSGVTLAEADEKVRDLLASNGFGFSLLEKGVSAEGLVTVNFSNPLMQEQRLWGARGNNKAVRAALGIGLAQPAQQATAVDEGQGEIPDEPPTPTISEAQKTAARKTNKAKRRAAR